MTSRAAREIAVLEPAGSRAEFARRVVVAVAIGVLAAALVASFVLAHQVFFLFFLAVLLAILLRSASDAISRWSGIGPGWSLAAVIVVLAAVLGGGAYALGSMVAAQLEQTVAGLPQSLEQVGNQIREYEWGRRLLSSVSSPSQFFSQGLGTLASSASTFLSATLGVVGNLVILLFLMIYLAASPRMYVSGLLLLVPPQRRSRARQVADAIGFHLRWWLVGRLVAVVTVGLITGIGLWIAGFPQFLVLALIAAAFTIIPYVGPIAGAIPGILLALHQGPTTALWAAVVYLLAQSVENYLVTPMVQQDMVRLPPAVTIISLVLGGSLFGVLGLIAAAPLAVTILVMVKMLYVEDMIGEQLDIPS